MKIVKVKDYEEMSKKAAQLVATQIDSKPDTVLGLATGSTPEGLYSELAKKYQTGEIDFSNVKTVNLDEYKGLTKDNSQSYYYYMYNNLFKNINIKSENANLPDGTNDNTDSECSRYDNIIKNYGGIDLQVLGIGANGHIGFNEPKNYFTKGTNCVKLTDSTIEANSRFFSTSDEVPKYAYTMGIKTIMEARQIILLVSGKNKAEILKKSLCGDITPEVPASILQLHKNVIVIADEEACSQLEV